MTETQKYEVKDYISQGYNRSTLYLFPMLYRRHVITSELITNEQEHGFRLVNLFVTDHGKPEYSNYHNHEHLLMLLKIVDYENKDFQYFINGVQRNESFETYYHVDEKLIMLVFKMNLEYQNIIRFFKQGKYSYFSPDYTENFLYDANTKMKSVYNIITKSPFLKKMIEKDLGTRLDDDAELDDRPYKNKEIFRYNGSY